LTDSLGTNPPSPEHYLEACLNLAWSQIKDRKGKTEGGVFVKEDSSTTTLVAHLQPSTLCELHGIAGLLKESAANLRGLMDTTEAESLQVREWLPDELEGSAFLLEEIANNTKKFVKEEA
jgi:hypothetical protein